MAQMTQAQITAELTRKAALGIKPTNTANQAQYDKLVAQKPTPTTNTGIGAGVGGTVPGGLTSSGGGWFAALDALKNSQNTTPGTAIGTGVGVPTTPNITPADTSSNNNVGTTAPTGMIQAMQQLPTYVPPTATGINFNDATNQVKGQLDPMFQRALEALQTQKHQDQLNGDQLGMARGGSHSGLAADLQNKVAIASAGKASDLDATRQTQTAQMAQDLVNRGQDNDFRNQQQALAQYLGINQLNLQQQGQQADYTGQYNGNQTMQSQNQNFQQGVQNADLTGWYKGLQTLQSQNQGFNQNLATNQYNQDVNNTKFNQNLQTNAVAYQKARDAITDGQYKTTFDNNVKQQGFENALKTALQAHQISNDNYQLAISQQNANTNQTQAANSAANQANDNTLQQAKFAYETDKNSVDNRYKQSQIDKNTADAQKQGLDDAYYKAVGLAQKDPLFATYDATKQSQIINTHYDNLKPKDKVSDNDIQQWLK